MSDEHKIAGKVDVLDAIRAINPDAIVIVDAPFEWADGFSTTVADCTIRWLEGTTPISNADIQTKLDEMQTTYNSEGWKRKRHTEYPAKVEFMEAWTEKEIGGDDTKWNEYVAKYNKVRSDNPK